MPTHWRSTSRPLSPQVCRAAIVRTEGGGRQPSGRGDAPDHPARIRAGCPRADGGGHSRGETEMTGAQAAAPCTAQHHTAATTIYIVTSITCHYVITDWLFISMAVLRVGPPMYATLALLHEVKFFTVFV